MFKINFKIEDKFTSLAVKEIFGLLEKVLDKKNLEKLEIVYSPSVEKGDFSLPCFVLTKSFGKSPVEIAKNLAEKIKLKKTGIIKKVQQDGSYLNFFVNDKKRAEIVLTNIFKQKKKLGENKFGKGKKVMIEYVSPNTNKPLHLGHGRNAFLGWALSNILEANGFKTIKVCLVNDRGVHIAKSVLAYKEKGKNLTPAEVGMKEDHFIGDYYVLFDDMKNENKEMEEKAHELLRKWEKGDKKTIELWKKMNDWALIGMRKTFGKIGIAFDKYYFESDIYKEGKDIIEKGLKEKKFIKKDKAVIADLEKYNLPEKVLLRSDGTALYITQDIYLTYLKYKDYKPNKIIHVIGSEQNLAQKQLFAIMDKLNFKEAKSLYHLSYGMVNVEGGKLKSREGTRVDLDTLVKDLGKMASMEIRARDEKLNEEKLERRSEKIALGALKYYILQYGPKSIVNFNPKESLSFNGKTGPYLQYSYARIKSILRKSDPPAGGKINTKVDFSKLKNKEERELLTLLGKFNETIKESGENYDPSILAKYLYELAKAFHGFYHTSPVMEADKKTKKARLLLIHDTAEVIKKGLHLLGIEVMEEM